MKTKLVTAMNLARGFNNSDVLIRTLIRAGGRKGYLGLLMVAAARVKNAIRS